MPMPLWWGHINKRLFNRRAVAGGKWPVLIHTGRRSGTTYRTPLGAVEVNGGYLFILVYGSGADWVRNVRASGTARLLVDGTELELDAPRLVPEEEALEAIPVSERPPGFMRITEFLRMDLAGH
ncbi:nitroreductase family deazaflavin-dependent oxidoreductase [Ruania alba]|uniref:Deazaflavin-dependent oxidoreductase, nitroreductase family n=1 Tax=Ruania alba TaxID=648782 RepID=A0A1H5LEB2_9MICO|nr:nitroreductase family deazaflavin-dependent oxidoreductase [Ruania alba]SEE74897.1 deazaflavin-dependent oxidoreductase, nitroreductase family [Ruania alba]